MGRELPWSSISSPVGPSRSQPPHTNPTFDSREQALIESLESSWGSCKNWGMDFGSSCRLVQWWSTSWCCLWLAGHNLFLQEQEHCGRQDTKRGTEGNLWDGSCGWFWVRSPAPSYACLEPWASPTPWFSHQKWPQSSQLETQLEYSLETKNYLDSVLTLKILRH